MPFPTIVRGEDHRRANFCTVTVYLCLCDRFLLSYSFLLALQVPAVHRLKVFDSKLQWSQHNRDVCFGIFDAYQKADALRNNLSANALKQFKAKSSAPQVCD